MRSKTATKKHPQIEKRIAKPHWYRTNSMSHDLARKIWELSSVDVPADDQLELKQYFHQKIKNDKVKVRKDLKRLVLKTMKKKYQPVVTTLTLDNNIITGGNITQYPTKTHKISDASVELKESIFTIKSGVSDLIEIRDPAAKFLIENAILPLGLKWKNDYGYIKVSWTHWFHN